MKTKITYPAGIKHCSALLLLTLLFCLEAYSQSPAWLWAHGAGAAIADYGYSTAIDASGNVYTTGYFQGAVDFDPSASVSTLTAFGLSDIFVSKFDGAGNFVWVKQLGGPGDEKGFCLVLDPLNADIFICGTFNGTTDFDPGAGSQSITGEGAFICKLNSSGNYLWAKAMTGATSQCQAVSMAVDFAGSGGIYTTGYFQNGVDFDPGVGIYNLTSAGSFDIFVSKLDNLGNFVWAKQMGGVSSFGDYGQAIAIDPSGNGDIYTTGFFYGTADFDPGIPTFYFTSNGVSDIFISKLNNAGDFVWAKRMGGTNDDHGQAILFNALGNLITTGYFGDVVDFDPGPGTFNLTASGLGGGKDVFISKLDSAGNFGWAKAMGGNNNDCGQSIMMDATGNIYLTGLFEVSADFDPGPGVFTMTSGGFSDIFVSKLDNAGNFVWAKGAGGTAVDRGRSIALDASGYVYITGDFQSHSLIFGSDTLTNIGFGTSDIFIAKLDTAIITGDNEILSSADILSIFPNPTSGALTIKTARPDRKTSVEIYTVHGEKIYGEKFFSDKLEVNMNNNPSGIYFVMLKNEKNIIAVKKLVKT